jgi:EAL domain-containing protein (putative c-di-GMP-specific phosphodiesterase class I)
LPLADRILRSLAEPFPIGDHEVRLGASVGIAISSSVGPVEGGPETLLSEADIAMYAAKDAGRNRAVVFEPDMRDRIRTRLELAAGLRRAVARDELHLVYQPVARLTDDSVVAIEAYVRWRHPGRGLLGPDVFLAAAEDSGVIVGMGEWVLDRAVADLAVLGDTIAADVVLSVNMSPRQLTDPELVLTIAETLERHAVAPSRLQLEFTESVLLDDPQAAVATLGRLATLGVGLAVDDFGSGMSSLAHLEAVPFRCLKVDRQLTGRAGREERAVALVRAVASLGHALGVTVVAEGVETTGQRAVVEACGCDAYQGFLLSRPLSIDDLAARLRG